MGEQLQLAAKMVSAANAQMVSDVEAAQVSAQVHATRVRDTKDAYGSDEELRAEMSQSNPDSVTAIPRTSDHLLLHSVARHSLYSVYSYTIAPRTDGEH